jgi:Cysteine-rich secretory protein family
MKNPSKSLFSLIFAFICPKSNNALRAVILFAAVLGIFLLPKTAWMATITPDSIITLTNNERSQNGLNTLYLSDQLTRAANAKAAAILAAQTFDHTIDGRRFSSWIKETGYQYSLAGENLAMDFVTSEGVVRAWMASPEHRANILQSEYVDIGVGIAEGKFAGQNTIIVAELFGDPLIKPAPIPASISCLDERIMPWEQNASLNGYLSIYHKVLTNISLATDEQISFF